MVKSIKPVVSVIESDEWQLLILGVTLLIFLTVLLYFTRYYYKKNYQTSTVFNSQTGESNPIVTPGDLKPCNKGECVVNLTTGLKKCPEKSQSVLYYNSTQQVCSPKNSCPSQVPYALNGDGSVNKYGVCENSKQVCSCTKEVTCPKYLASKFSVANGNIYSSYPSEKNFLLEQVPYSVFDSYQDSMVLKSQGEFCKINSTYSNQLVGGCSFLNQTNDFLMKCDKESLDPTISVSPYSLNPYYLSTTGKEEKQFCEIQPYLDSNWNNMTLCVNQNPCKLGNYTYNFDQYRTISETTTVNGKSVTNSVLNTNVKGTQLNSRNFCQSYASNLDTYLTDLQYYTLSCIKGTRCNVLPDVEDDTKFFSGTTSELDISAINASYTVNYNNNFLTSTTDYNYNPIKNQVQSGDLVLGPGFTYTHTGGSGYKVGVCTVSVNETDIVIDGYISAVGSDGVDSGIIEKIELYGNVTTQITSGLTGTVSQTTGVGTGEKVTFTPQSQYYIVRVNPTSQKVSFYNFSQQTFLTYIPIHNYKEALTNFYDGQNITYYPQYALNGFGYNTISTNDLDKIMANSTNGDFSQNAGYSFKIGNANKSTIPSETKLGGGYNPSFDIISNGNFFRGGLSKPRGYVYKEFIESEVVKEDLSDNGTPPKFKTQNYEIKQTPFNTQFYYDISFYNPVWNNQYGRTECIRCNPLLVASINMAQIDDNGSATGFIYDAATIQFSGKDFAHYRKNFGTTEIEKIWCFESRSKLNLSKQSNQNKIYLDRPNPNIKIGDLVLSSQNNFPFVINPIGEVDSSYNNKTFYIFIGDIYQTATGAVNFTPFEDFGTTKHPVPESDWVSKDFFGLGRNNNTFQDFNKKQFITAIYDSSSKSFKVSSISNFNTQGAFFFGNKYTATNINKDLVPSDSVLDQAIVDKDTKFIDVTIVPSVTVSDNTNGVITTTGFTGNDSNFPSKTLNINETLQFVSLTRNLYLNTKRTNPNEPLPGSGGEIQIDEITDGRITSIKVISPGSGYSNTSPFVRLESYDAYLN